MAGPMRCVQCGDVSERRADTSLTSAHPDHGDFSFFGASWSGGLLRPGARIAVGVGAIEDGRDRGDYARLRPPANREELVVLEQRTDWECRCGAGRVLPCLRFAIAPGELVLASLEARVARQAAELADVDFVLADEFLWQCQVRQLLGLARRNGGEVSRRVMEVLLSGLRHDLGTMGPLVDLCDGLSPADLAVVLAMLHGRMYESLIRECLCHDSALVREAAAEALKRLEGFLR